MFLPKIRDSQNFSSIARVFQSPFLNDSLCLVVLGKTVSGSTFFQSSCLRISTFLRSYLEFQVLESYIMNFEVVMCLGNIFIVQN